MENFKASILIRVLHSIGLIVAQNDGNAPLQRVIQEHLLNMIVPSPMAGASSDRLSDLTHHFLASHKLVGNKTFLENPSRYHRDFVDIVRSPEKRGNS